jgi:hypothetical protein
MEATAKDYARAVVVVMRAAGGIVLAALAAPGRPLCIDPETGRVEVAR